MSETQPIAAKLRKSGILIILGLLVEALTLVWNHPLAFIAFIGISGLLMAIGILLYLWALVSHSTQKSAR